MLSGDYVNSFVDTLYNAFLSDIIQLLLLVKMVNRKSSIHAVQFVTNAPDPVMVIVFYFSNLFQMWKPESIGHDDITQWNGIEWTIINMGECSHIAPY